MTEEEREAHRDERRAWWTTERRAEQSARAHTQFETWAEEHPGRAAVVAELWRSVESGETERPDCGICMQPMHPTYDWEALAVTGWRCRRCRS